MLEQYFAVKNENKDAVVMFQVGSFYQFYYHDAELAVKILKTKMISRAVGGGKRIPMCGVPKNSMPKHSKTLAEHGYKVVVCSQTINEESGAAERCVTQVIQPEAEKIDLTDAWESYLQNPVCIEAPPRRASKSHSGDDMLEELRSVDLAQMTPMEALQLLQTWKEKYLRDAQ